MIGNSDRIFSSVFELEQAMVEAASKGELVLTATSRLSRRVLHCYRLGRIKRKDLGWKTPTIFGFNRWIKNTFDTLWEHFRPLSRLGAFRLWDEVTQRIELPEGLRPGPSLNLRLQEAFDLLSRHGQALVGPSSGHTLADWRREVFKHFLALLEKNQYIPWTKILERVGKAVAEGRISLPENIILAGFNELANAEESLVKVLAGKSKVEIWHALKNPDQNMKVRVYATPDQECQSICAKVLKSWNSGQKRLGVVFLDQDYFKLLKRSFEELADREERPPNALRYNLTMGTPLSEHPLFQTALLPLRLLGETQPNALLSSLLFSPYVMRPQDGWDLDIKTSLWSSGGANTLKGTLLRLRDIGCPIQPLQNLSLYQKKPMKVWLQDLESLWSHLGFPISRCETDTLAKEHLLKILGELRKEVGHLEMGRNEVQTWFKAASQGIEIVEKTPETAGIQILNLVESRGLSFDRLWVVGAHGRALPQPARGLPLLDPDEIQKVEGGTVEKQWETGQHNLSCLLAAAPHVTFSRAISKDEDFPFLPCPLIPDESSHEGSPYTVDLWKDPTEEMLRIRWLREGLKGVRRRSQKLREEIEERVNFPLPKLLGVTQFEDLLLCPFKFFARNLLDLEPLEEPIVGIEPKERGGVIHKILKEFTQGLAAAAPDWPHDKGKALEFLEKTVDNILGKYLEDPFWQVECLRLLGDDESPGLLKEWLEKERERASEGWRFEVAEESFEELSIGDTGIVLNGRVDRVDSHPEKGKALWDYKTSDSPPDREVLEDMVRPQLPAYLLSLKQGHLPRLGEWSGQVKAGYITLKKASEVEIEDLKNVDWEDFLPRWKEWVKKRLEGPLKGLYSADPKPPPSSLQNEGACKHCPFPNLCDFKAQGVREEEGSEDLQEGDS
jgi:RecB family exonuclease